MPLMRYLTKSRFKLGVECPAKLFYTGKSAVFADTSLDDEFLRALAEGGYQVGELAKLMFPGGAEVTARGHADQIAQTQALLAQDRVTIFEAAISAGNLFARVDILHKDGAHIELIEVKSKSYDPGDTEFFETKTGELKSGMLPYLQDIAFQRYVFGLAFPLLTGGASSHLMLVDKSKTCSVDRLNQKFRIRRVDGRASVTLVPGTDADSIGTPLLTKIAVAPYVTRIVHGRLQAPGLDAPFAGAVAALADAYAADRQLSPALGSQCGKCQFRLSSAAQAPGLRSGLHECWTRHGVNANEVDHCTVLDLWNFRGKSDLISAGRYRLSDVTKDDLTLKQGKDGLSRSERQWMQASGDLRGQAGFYLDRDVMRAELQTWRFPLHFIDFETTRVAIPFTAGQRPYGNVAFQFSHHTVDASGRVEHRSQFLNATPGFNPNYEFARALMADLGDDDGTVFRWSHHENTILNAILDELSADAAPPADAADLERFLLTLTTRGKGGSAHRGARAMVDLCALAEHAFFHPDTKGSSSIKKVLPAVMRESAYLKERYGQPIYGDGCAIPSLNVAVNERIIWWSESGGCLVSPYAKLPPVFPDVARAALAALNIEEEMEVREGGAAMTAYARLQFEDLPPELRLHIEAALRRYCELDTLAMVMIYEAWREWVA